MTGNRPPSPDVPNPPARNAVDRLIRRFNYTAYVAAVLFLYAMASTAVGIALAPALLVLRELRSLGQAWPEPGRLAWTGTSFGVSFFVFGFTLLLVVPIYNFVLPTRMKPFKGGYFTIAALPFYLHNGLFYLVRFTVLPFFTLTPFGLLFLKAMGMKVGRRVFVNTELISDPCLITLEDDTVLGGSVRVFAHWGGGGHLAIAPVRVRRGATIGLAATIMGDVEVGEGAVVLPHSVLLPGSRVGAGETWGGVPARPIGTDERERFRRLVQGIEEGEEPDQ